MTVVRSSEGWIVISPDGMRLAGPFDTMADGWRWIDRAEGEPVSRGETVAEWVWSKQIDQ